MRLRALIDTTADEMLPFSHTQFFDVFERYNLATWPAPVVAYVLGLAAVAAAVAAPRRTAGFTLASLAALWAWTGASYHLFFFAPINPAARLFGLLFLAQAILLVFHALAGKIELGARGGWDRAAALAMIAYAAVFYPLINTALGHAYPRAPSFGVTPCPLVIFTLGTLLLARARVPWVLLATPLVWSVIGGSAAVLLNVVADWALPASGVLAALLNARKPSAQPTPSAPG
jgi:hypothetical protein